MPAPFGAFQPGSPGRAPLLPAQFGGDYRISADGEVYNPYQYFLPGTTSYTISLVTNINPNSTGPETDVYRTLRASFAPGTPLQSIVNQLTSLVTAMEAMYERGSYPLTR